MIKKMMNAMITKMIKKWEKTYFKDFQCVAGSVLHNSKLPSISGTETCGAVLQGSDPSHRFGEQQSPQEHLRTKWKVISLIFRSDVFFWFSGFQWFPGNVTNLIKGDQMSQKPRCSQRVMGDLSIDKAAVLGLRGRSWNPVLFNALHCVWLWMIIIA
jgi:hypothetical protein